MTHLQFDTACSVAKGDTAPSDRVCDASSASSRIALFEQGTTHPELEMLFDLEGQPPVMK
jgi:hypothetical protein